DASKTASQSLLAIPADAAWLRAASDTLGVARKTLLKLLPSAVIADLAAEAERRNDGGQAPQTPGESTAPGGVRGLRSPGAVDAAEHARRLRGAAAEALLAMLEAREFNQSSVATTLGTSRTTLIKLMDDLGLPRAADLDADAILGARARAGGDLDAAAR